MKWNFQSCSQGELFFFHVYSQDEQFSSPKLQEARPAGLWQGSDGWLPLTEEDTIQEGIRWIQMGSDGVWWVIATDWVGYNSRRAQMGSDGFRWVQMGSDGWLPLTEEDTIQEENFHRSS